MGRRRISSPLKDRGHRRGSWPGRICPVRQGWEVEGDSHWGPWTNLQVTLPVLDFAPCHDSAPSRTLHLIFSSLGPAAPRDKGSF